MSTQQIFDTLVDHLTNGNLGTAYVNADKNGNCQQCAKGRLMNVSKDIHNNFFSDKIKGNSRERINEYVGRSITDQEWIMINEFENIVMGWILNTNRDIIPQNRIEDSMTQKERSYLTQQERFALIAKDHGLRYKPVLHNNRIVLNETLI